jgi:solute:Na+ symporter, SSS family
MDFYSLLDCFVFFGFLAIVITVGIVMSRGEEDSEGYFLAGRGLAWWLIGFSLIAANISTEQFIGMSGQAADYVGLAIASYEWMAAITLIVVAFFFLPKFLRAGIYTIPEFLEYRFNHSARTLMSLFMMVVYVCVTITAVIYSGALTADVLYGDKPLFGLHLINVTSASWIIGVMAAVYVVSGGLKACAWADLLLGSALIVGGAIVTCFAFHALGNADPKSIGLDPSMFAASSIEKFSVLNHAKLHMVLPASDLILPWTALVVGLWIPNFYYWGLNQYITQRTLGAQSLADGQKGVIFAAGLKLIIPFIIVIPGIIAFNIYKDDMRDEAANKTNLEVLDEWAVVQGNPASAHVAFAFDKEFATIYPDVADKMADFNQAVLGTQTPFDSSNEPPMQLVNRNNAIIKAIEDGNTNRAEEGQIKIEKRLIGYKFDSAFALLIKKLIPRGGLQGFIMAAIAGAVISSLAAMLNAASTIFTMDLYRQYLNRNATQANLVAMGRLCVVIFACIGCYIAPKLDNPKWEGIFTYIQEFQGFISPGVLAVFIFGLFIHRAPRACGVVGLLISPIVYGLLKWVWPQFDLPEIAFLDRMAITFAVALLVLGTMTVVKPLAQPVVLPEQNKIALVSSGGAKFCGAIVVLVTLSLYWYFF